MPGCPLSSPLRPLPRHPVSPLLDAIYVAVWPWLLLASWRIYQKLPNNPSGRTIYIKANPHGSLFPGSVEQSKKSADCIFTGAISVEY